MRQVLVSIIGICGVACSTIGHAAPINDPLLERLTGTWVLKGTIAGQPTTHDVVAEWVLGREYMKIHEVSREQDDKGRPKYEAIVLIGWDEVASEFQCLWLDSTGGGGLTGQGIGHGKRTGDAIPLVFRDPGGSVSFNNTFSYDKGSDSWLWHMDNVQNGKATSFGIVRLTRPSSGK